MDSQNARALAVLRIGVALFFLIFAQYKILSTQFTLHGGFQFWINKFLTEGGGRTDDRATNFLSMPGPILLPPPRPPNL